MNNHWIDANEDFNLNNENNISENHHQGKKFARSYVVFQKTCLLFPIDECLKKGTAFPSLYDPYYSEEPLSF